MAWYPLCMPKKRRAYHDACAMAHAMDLVGDRWALLVVRELILGPKRFTDLRAGLPGISPNVLSERLEELERFAIVRRRLLAPPASAWAYELTEWGLQLEPAMMALGRWAARSPFRPRAGLSTDALILSFRTMFDRRAAAGFKAKLELRIGADVFRGTVARSRLTLVRGPVDHADAVLEADANTLAAVVYGGRKFTEALRAGELRVEGSKPIARRFLTLFPLPELAG